MRCCAHGCTGGCCCCFFDSFAGRGAVGWKKRLHEFCIGCLTWNAFALQAPGSTAHVLKLIVTLYALKRLESDMGWLLTEGILSLQAGRQIPNEVR